MTREFYTFDEYWEVFEYALAEQDELDVGTRGHRLMQAMRPLLEQLHREHGRVWRHNPGEMGELGQDMAVLMTALVYMMALGYNRKVAIEQLTRYLVHDLKHLIAVMEEESKSLLTATEGHA